MQPFDDKSAEVARYFASGNDVPVGGGDWGNDRLCGHTQRAGDAFMLDSNLLYNALRTAEGLFINVHMPAKSGAFSVRFGCNRCMAMTPEFQPQYEIDTDGKHKDLRHCDEVKSAFRAFMSLVLNIDLKEIKCRHLYGASGRVGGMQAIANQSFHP